ncbi:MAG: S1 RNA-binding domain-containing protein [Anaerolineae bacterium]|nr:S1 RNA-binding domain-containing protein [Anaerolineae bacterium]
MMLTGEWVPPDAPPDEGYWEALLRDGEQGPAAPAEAQLLPWNLEFSGRSASHEIDPWEIARQVMEQGETIQPPVIGWNRGGVVVGWNGLRGFVPASHLRSIPATSRSNLDARLQSLIGRQLKLKIIELDPHQGRLVLSEQPFGPDGDGHKRSVESLCPGDVCQGYVTTLSPFGAFVDLGDVEGLIHISELSWGRVGHPAEVLRSGQLVHVYVLSVDRERGRVRLSLKRLQPDPWSTVEEKYQPGQLVEGTITSVTDFGAFMQIEPGLEGLIHVSEFHPRYTVQEGSRVTARILSVDRERRRIALTLRVPHSPR